MRFYTVSLVVIMMAMFLVGCAGNPNTYVDPNGDCWTLKDDGSKDEQVNC